MKTIDNSLINEPCIGKLIEEKCAIGQLEDNCIYLLADPKSTIAARFMEAGSWIQNKLAKEEYFNEYRLDVLESIELKNHPLVAKEIYDNKRNLLLSLYLPEYEGKKFLLSSTAEDDLVINLALMTYEAERNTQDSIVHYLREYALEDMDGFMSIAKEAFSTKRFLNAYFARLAGDVMHPTFGMAASVTSIKEELDIKGVITHQKRLEILNNLPEKLLKYRKTKNPKLGAEIDLFFINVDAMTWKQYFLRQSPKIQEKMFSYLNSQNQAKNSTMDLEVRYFPNIDKTRKNDGHYRLLMCKNPDTLAVHFSRKNSFIVYLIYLLDRKMNGDKVDTLNLSQYKVLFCKLYEMTYGLKGEREFDNMMKRYNSKDEVQQKELSVVLHTMKMDIGTTCEKMEEPPEPFILKDSASHLTVLPKHIILPSEIIALV
ncbi:hypothetical protein [uncultured Parabacteroides sp.]|jgi:hypothetical protein|uniref:hypothetical protein n=1 Tax=uncultured Parabacteroides sp. TaxID=512312 RepID=UPI0025F53A54|nr:hypothetical protein [uncultured Parabacteroides sp.]